MTTSQQHPAHTITNDDLTVIPYENNIDFEDLFKRLKREFGIENITIQSGGTLNATLLRKGLLDYLSLVIAPALIGGNSTPTLIDGPSLRKQEELSNIKALDLQEVHQLKNSYLHLKYRILN